MNDKMKLIRLYRVVLDESWEKFASRFAAETGLSWQTVYKVVTGKAENPHERTVYKIDTWLEKNKGIIEDTVGAAMK